MTPERLRALAAELEAAAQANLERAQLLRAEADAMEKGWPLPASVNDRIINRSGMFTSEHKVNMGKAKLKNPRNKLAAAAYAAVKPDGTVGYSLVALAKAAGVSNALLTLAYQGKRPMPTRAAEKIQELTGYPVSSWKQLS